MPPPQVPTTFPSPSLPLSTMVKVGLVPPLASIFLAISSLSSSQDLGPDCAESVSDAQKRTAAVMRSFMVELAFCPQGLRTMMVIVFTASQDGEGYFWMKQYIGWQVKSGKYPL